MNDIVFTVKKSMSARVFVLIALSLVMAVLVGAGWHPAKINGADPVAPQPTSVQTSASPDVVAPIANSASDQTSAFDKAIRTMSVSQRQAQQAAAAQTDTSTQPNSNPASSNTSVSKTSTSASTNASANNAATNVTFVNLTNIVTNLGTQDGKK